LFRSRFCRRFVHDEDVTFCFVEREGKGGGWNEWLQFFSFVMYLRVYLTLPRHFQRPACFDGQALSRLYYLVLLLGYLNISDPSLSQILKEKMLNCTRQIPSQELHQDDSAAAAPQFFWWESVAPLTATQLQPLWGSSRGDFAFLDMPLPNMRGTIFFLMMEYW
jgi:hypothetical protein